MRYIFSLLFVFISSSSVIKAQFEQVNISPSEDTYVLENCSTCTYGSSETLTTGKLSGPGQFYVLMKFDLPDSVIESNAVITEAKLILHRESGPLSISDNEMTIKYLTNSWDENTCNYNTCQNLGKSSNRIISAESSWYDSEGLVVDMRDLIQHWERGDIINNGFIINYSGSLIDFYSKEASNEDYRPVLQVKYFIPAKTIYVNENVTIDDSPSKNTNPYNLYSITYDYYNCLSYINFNFSEIDTTKNIVAFLELSGGGHSSTQYSGIELYPVTGAWTASGISWSNKPDISTAEMINLSMPKNPYQDYLVDITGILMAHMFSGFSDLHGFEIKKPSDGMYDNTNFYSKINEDSLGPKIHIFYVKPKWYKSGANIYFNDGNIGIGTSSDLYNAMLTVNGKIRTSSAECVSSITSDYVFDPEYQLMTLKEINIYIKKHGHLPGIPSVSEFSNQGQDLSEMDNLLLKKTEELTLYIILKEKMINERKKRIEQLKDEIKILKEK